MEDQLRHRQCLEPVSHARAHTHVSQRRELGTRCQAMAAEWTREWRSSQPLVWGTRAAGAVRS
eukprot:3545880-Rhodomonas_salina.2